MVKNFRMFLALIFSILLPAISLAASSPTQMRVLYPQLRRFMGDCLDRQGSGLLYR